MTDMTDMTFADIARVRAALREQAAQLAADRAAVRAADPALREALRGPDAPPFTFMCDGSDGCRCSACLAEPTTAEVGVALIGDGTLERRTLPSASWESICAGLGVPGIDMFEPLPGLNGYAHWLGAYECELNTAATLMFTQRLHGPVMVTGGVRRGEDVSLTDAQWSDLVRLFGAVGSDRT